MNILLRIKKHTTFMCLLTCLFLSLSAYEAKGVGIFTDVTAWSNAVVGASLVNEDFESFADGLVTDHLDTAWGAADSVPGGILIKSLADPITQGNFLGSGTLVEFTPLNAPGVIGFSFVYSIAAQSNKDLKLKILGGTFGTGTEFTVGTPGDFGFFGVTLASGETLGSFSVDNDGGSVRYDNITFAADPIPEPSTLLLLSLGFLGVLFGRFRSRQKTE